MIFFSNLIFLFLKKREILKVGIENHKIYIYFFQFYHTLFSGYIIFSFPIIPSITFLLKEIKRPKKKVLLFEILLF